MKSIIPNPEEKGLFVQDKFASVSKRYDLLNSLLSCYIDHYWRKKAAKELSNSQEGPFLDLCAGTLPLSIELVKQHKRPVIAVDFCFDMLNYGVKERLHKKNGNSWPIFPICGDGQELPLKEGVVEGITIAFGIRNLSDVAKGLAEMIRVLKPGGKLVILEFSRPSNPIFGPVYKFYLHKILPHIGGLISKDKEAYRYLAQSIEAFYSPKELCAMMQDIGFSNVSSYPLTFGIVTIYTGIKPNKNDN